MGAGYCGQLRHVLDVRLETPGQSLLMRKPRFSQGVSLERVVDELGEVRRTPPTRCARFRHLNADLVVAIDGIGEGKRESEGATREAMNFVATKVLGACKTFICEAAPDKHFGECRNGKARLIAAGFPCLRVPK